MDEHDPESDESADSRFLRPYLPPTELDEPALESGSRPASKVFDELTARVVERLSGRSGTFGRYRVEGEVARGGQGAILRVWDQDLSRQLAMKVILEREGSPASTARDSRSVGRFLEEAQVTGQLDHPGIVPVHELGLDDRGHFYFTMKLVRGRDLAQVYELVREGAEGWNLTRALGVFLKVCEAMAYAHSKSVVHRDLKPSNVMVGKFGEVYVMDWGLARVLGEEDRKDVRVKPADMGTVEVRMEHRRSEEGSTDAPLITMDGDVVGTPAYMSPEQALGRVDRIGPRSDVYCVGAMLYHLLAQHAPYVPEGARPNNYVVWNLVQAGPPRPLALAAPNVPPELVAICEKAMARRLDDRYADMLELGEDLRAYLENRVVRAHRTGAAIELAKWVRRNPALASVSAAAIVLLVAGLGAVSWVQARGRRVAEHERTIARANELEADHQRELAQEERANVLRLSAFQNLADLERRADELWPIRPGSKGDYEAWLRDASALLEEVGFAQAQLEALRARALPPTPEVLERSRTLHPRHAELVRLRARRDSVLAAERVRRGDADPVVPEIGGREAQRDALLLNRQAWPLVDPERAEFGREAEGLALARLARERASTDADRYRVARTLAYALAANGLFEDALGVLWSAREEAPVEYAPPLDHALSTLEEAVIAAEEGALDDEARRLDAEIDALETEVAGFRVYEFASDEDRWWHGQLENLVRELEEFADEEHGLIQGASPEHSLGVRRRLVLADTLAATLEDPRWEPAVASIGDPSECPQYRGLHVRPQLGLVPLGRDPDSGLWEFAHVATGSVPERDANGRLLLEPDVGVVLVLLPGGTFRMGAQSGDPALPNHDPLAIADEGPVHEVTLDPFFLSKFELTQAQWKAFNGENPSTYSEERNTWSERHTSALHPVEQVSWFECERTLGRLALLLPTEAQWEYAARAGTDTVWWTGARRESLAGAVNFADASAKRWGATWAGVDDWMDDGKQVHAPAGTYRANAFGFSEMIGNIGEWCRDSWSDYHTPWAVGDGLREATGSIGKLARGGNFAFPVEATRLASRPAWEPRYRANFLGVRPAREIEP